MDLVCFYKSNFIDIFGITTGPSSLNQGPHDGGELRGIGRPTVCRKMVVLICFDHHKCSFTMDNATMYSTKLNSVHLPKCKPIFSLRRKTGHQLGGPLVVIHGVSSPL